MKTYKVTVDSEGTTKWYLKNKLHREDGPAIECANGDKVWYLNDQCHREDGPAIEWANGYKWWYINGQRHREDGPAIEYASGYKSWYLNDQRLTEAQFNARTKQPSCEGKVVEIDGKKYKLQEVK
jgi:hypothetical protein